MDAAATRSTLPDALKKLVAGSPEWMVLFDRDRRYCQASPPLAAALDASNLAWLGRHNTELAELAKQAGLPKVWRKYWQQVEDALMTVQQQRKAEKRVHALPNEDGDLQLCEVSYTPICDAQGQVESVVSISHPTVVPQGLYESEGKSLTAAQLEAYPDAIVGAEMPDLTAASLAHVPTPLAAAASPLASRLPIPAVVQPGLQVHQTAEFLQVVLDNIPQYIFWKNLDSVYLGCNQRWAEMAGFNNPSEVVGITDADLPWTPEEAAWYLKCDRRVMATDTPMLRIKESQMQADGKLSWRETSKLPLHDAQGNVVGLLGTIEDITERKIAEDLLKQSEATYRKLAKQEELLNQISQQIRQSLSVAEIQQRTVQEVRQLFHVDRMLIYRFDEDWLGRVVTESVEAPWRSLLDEESQDSCFPEEHAAMYLQGRVRTIPNVATAELDECHRDFLLGMQVQANAIVPILVRDELWGLLIAHQCSGPRDWQDEEIKLLNALAAQVSIAIQQAELYAQTKQSGELAQQKAAELENALQTLQKTQTQLVQTEKMSGLGQMVAGIAHEINNPVNFIYGNIPHIKEHLTDLTDLLSLYRENYPEPVEAVEEFIEEIDLDYVLEDLSKILKSFQIGSQRIQQIVTSLRTFSRLDEAEKKDVDLHDGIDSTLLILQHRLKAKSDRSVIEVSKDYADLPLVECYPSQLNQVFMNILGNGIDALEQEMATGARADKTEPPTIAISTQQLPGEVLICIRDNGPGIDEKHRARLFDPFFTTKPIGKGTGLGLSISHQIVTERHGGRLIVISEIGQGTEFQIYVPLAHTPL
ncbi:GAF domain-containing sensor histidine kinase [Leptolyngbya iicbica]|uniref:histidine kinase n=2 Tax=Cyanophyceae TaxID=3028117 RepID=A0A4V2E2A9_9CYAN|nr:GAF domain-containing protein [Leptolyngbya sp. LK]RZM77716.1 GAF domain-containing protein [Leptolyngbya sp. LK]